MEVIAAVLLLIGAFALGSASSEAGRTNNVETRTTEAAREPEPLSATVVDKRPAASVTPSPCRYRPGSVMQRDLTISPESSAVWVQSYTSCRTERHDD